MPHGCHIYAKASDMEKVTMFAYTQSDNELPHWKCVLRCCYKCSSVNIPDQETNGQYSNTRPTISFHTYHLIERCTTHGNITLNYRNICCMCRQDSASDKSTKIYTRNELVMMETKISNFHTNFYVPVIQKLAFHLPHVQILDTNHCGDSRRTEFKRQKSFQYVLCCRD